MNIETLATSAVESLISKTDNLIPYISNNDKTASYDGEVYICNNNEKRKENAKIVKVQVKGKTTNKPTPTTINYSINIRDLTVYEKNGGVFYFVVYINSCSGNVENIYYTELLPLKVSRILKRTKNTVTVSVLFQSLDTNPETVASLFDGFYENSKKQVGFVDSKLPTIEELQKSGRLKGLSFNYSGIKRDRNNPYGFSLKNGLEMYLYADVEDYPVSIPIDFFESVSHIKMYHDEKIPIYVGNKKFFDSIRIEREENVTSFVINNCFSFVFQELPDGSEKRIFNITTNGTLNQQLTNLPFLKALLSEKKIRIGLQDIVIDVTKENLEALHYDEFDERIKGLQAARETLDSLKVYEDLDLSACSEKDIWQFNILINAVHNKKTIYGLNDKLPAIVTFIIKNLHIVMLCDKTDDGGYCFQNIFDHQHKFVVFDESETPEPVSQFSLFKKNDFLTVNNLNVDFIVDDFSKLACNKYNIDNGINVMLEMLKAYDESKNDLFLCAAEKMNTWLTSVSKYINQDILIINTLQIIARRRKLTFEEKKPLVKIASESMDPMFMLASLILLGEDEEAKKIYLSLSDENKNQFKNYPVFSLYNMGRNEHIYLKESPHDQL